MPVSQRGHQTEGVSLTEQPTGLSVVSAEHTAPTPLATTAQAGSRIPLPATVQSPAAPITTTHDLDADDAHGPRRADGDMPVQPGLSGASSRSDNAPAQTTTGRLSLEVIANDTVNAGEYIIYTFAYSNTNQNDTATDVVVRATWTDFGVLQLCEVAGCDVLDFEGPPVIRDPGTDEIRFLIDDLGPGVEGKFRVQIKTDPNAYPKTAMTPTRLQVSGWIYQNGSDIQDDSDTFSATIVGPVFVLEKKPVSDIAVRGQGEFVLTIGNATAPEDSPGGTIRADARNANNLIIQDTFYPQQVEVVQTVEPDGFSVEIDEDAGRITWTTSEVLKPGNQISVRVVYRNKDDGSCEPIGGNTTFNVTSDEMFEGLQVWSPPSLPVTFETSMQISILPSTPPAVYYGDTADIAILVQNWQEESLSGVTLEYTVQEDATFEEDLTEGINAQVDGNRVTWTFDIGAGGPNPDNPDQILPGEKTFTLRIRGEHVWDGTFGEAKITPPAGIERVCAAILPHRVDLLTRLTVAKYTETEKEPFPDAYRTYVVDFNRGESFPYTIKVTNNGSTQATGVNIIDKLPNTVVDAQMLFVDSGYFTLNGNVTLRVNGSDERNITDKARIVRQKPETLLIEGIDIPPQSEVTIHYELKGEVLDYTLYCNSASAERPVAGSETGEPVAIDPNFNRVCTQTNPDIGVDKRMHGNPHAVAPGAPITFTLSITNNEDIAYTVGFMDDLVSKPTRVTLGGSFTYVSQINGYTTPDFYDIPGAEWLDWPVRNLDPGESLQATIVANTPTPCLTGPYVNSLYLTIRSGTRYYPATEYGVAPPDEAWVPVECATPEVGYTKRLVYPVDGVAVPEGKVVYEVVATNVAGVETLGGVIVEDLLPEGFQYRQMITEDPDGLVELVQQEPQQSSQDGRTRLRWTFDQLEPQESAYIRFEVIASSVPGLHYNDATARATTPDESISSCLQGKFCRVLEHDDGSVQTYAFAGVNVYEDLGYEKWPDPGTVRAGDQVVFTVFLSNNHPEETIDQPIAVEDLLPPGFSFVDFTEDSQVKPATQQESGPDGRTRLVWTVDEDIPAKTYISMKYIVKSGFQDGMQENWLKATVPNRPSGCAHKPGVVCNDDNYAVATVNVLPPGLVYKKTTDRPRVSLEDRVAYTLSIRNANQVESIRDVTVDDILPEGFEYIELHPLSMVETDPEIEENALGPRTKLTWTIDEVAAGEEVIIQYIARAGGTTGLYDNWLIVAAGSGDAEAICDGACIPITDTKDNDDPEDDETTVYAFTQVDVRALITVEPRIEPENAGCARPTDRRRYVLTISNENDHEYTDMQMDVTMPIGLKYKGMITRDIPAPSVITGTNELGVAQTILRWEDLYIPEYKPEDGIITQVVIEVDLEVGNVWHDLTTKVEASSADGAIPARGKDQEDNPTPTVAICQDTSGIRKDVDRNFVHPDDPVVYQLELFNTNDRPISVALDDQLPGEFEYIEMVRDTESTVVEPAYDPATNRLTWPDITLPVSDVVRLQYRVRAKGMPGQTYNNTVTATVPDGLNFETTYNSASVRIDNPVTMQHRIIEPIDGCVAPGTDLTYEVTLTNPNQRPYEETSLNIKLPFGMRYEGVESGTPTPAVVRMNETGGKTLSWNNLSIEAGTRTFLVKLQVTPVSGQLWAETWAVSSSGPVEPMRLSTSPLRVCEPTEPTIYKTVDRTLAQKDDIVQYVLTIFLPDSVSSANATIQDVLPPGLVFEEFIDGPAPTDAAQLGANVLKWENLQLSSSEPTVMRFAAKITAEPQTVIENTVEVLESSIDLPVDSRYAVVAVTPLVSMVASLPNAETCNNPDDMVAYTLMLENPTDYDEKSMRVEFALPHGLHYDADANAAISASGDVTPTITTGVDGKETITWDNMLVAARPNITYTTQITLMVNLQVGTAVGDLKPEIRITGLGGTATLAPDTAPGITVPCPDSTPNDDGIVSEGGLVLALEAQPDVIEANGEVEYLISAANFNPTPVDIVVESTVPQEFYYEDKGQGQPSPDDNSRKLVWTLRVLPATADGKPGTLESGPQSFTARVRYDAPDGRYDNILIVLSSSLTSLADDDPMTVTKVVEVRSSGMRMVYLPVVQRQ